jgi:glycosyltransferase involved in cell wall biosynthesis
LRKAALKEQNGLDLDVVVCTKNRHGLLRRLLDQINTLPRFNLLVIVDSSDVPFAFEQGMNAKTVYIYDPTAKLGCARQIGLEACISKYVFFVDDKVNLSPQSVPILYDALDKSKDPSVVAVSGKMIVGYNDPVLRKLSLCSRPFQEGENGGFVMLKRKEVLDLGGFNRRIHWGEDVELHQRLNAKGLKWRFIPNALASYELSFAEALATMKRHGRGCRAVITLFGGSFKLSARLFVRLLIMPILYGIMSTDPRVFGYYFLMNLCLMYGFLVGK